MGSAINAAPRHAIRGTISPRVRLNVASFGDINIFQLGVALQGRHAEIAAEAALLEAAEGRLRVDARVRVDAQHSAFNRARHANRAAEIIRPKRPAQAV